MRLHYNNVVLLIFYCSGHNR